MRIAVIGGSDTKSGGAGRVAVDLTKVLNKAGHHATHFLGLAEQGYTQNRRPLYGGKRMTASAQWTERKLERLGLRHTLPLDMPGLFAARVRQDFDVLHFHDLGAGMSPLSIAAFSRLMPTFWTFHDCSPFTGGCLYPMDCERYLTRCGTDGGCPQFGEWPLNGLYNLVGPLQAMRVFAHHTGRIKTIAPSAWLADVAFASGKLPGRPHVVSNGVDVATFIPARDRRALREQLGLPLDQPVILLTAARIEEKRKGMEQALEAIRAIPELRPFVLIVGRPNPALDAALGAIPHRATGFLSENAELARWYSAADVMLNCSLADNQPLVVFEAMACGVPTIGFATGGIPEMIRQGETGFLVPPLDMKGLIDALRHTVSPGVAANWGKAGRLYVEQNFSSQNFLEGHVNLYNEVLQGNY
jgi:glycosyltransferase involved in cell wall biosynthesis